MPTAKQLDEADRLLADFDWSAIDEMSDEEIRSAWAWDQDAVWPTDAELAEFRVVGPEQKRRQDAAE